MLIFGMMYPVRHQIIKLMNAVKSHDAQQSGLANVKNIAKKRGSVANIQVQLRWLTRKFQDYQPACWCA